jgi:hypothetical protein
MESPHVRQDMSHLLRTQDGEHRAICELRGLTRGGVGRYAASVVMQTRSGSSTSQQVRPFTSALRFAMSTLRARLRARNEGAAR